MRTRECKVGAARESGSTSAVPSQRSAQRPDLSAHAEQGEGGHAAGSRIKILLAEDLDLLRSALVSLLSDEDDIEVVAAMKCNDTVTEIAIRRRPDVVVVDVDLSCTSGLTLVRELRTRIPKAQIVVLTVAKPPGLVRRLLAAGVLGAVDKNAPAARLLQAIRRAAKGELGVDVELAVAALAVAPSPLTPREVEVLSLAAEGASGPETAEKPHLSRGTVRNYLSKAMTKTCARTRVGATSVARNAGWI